jgi:replicative DNA helicase
MANHTVKRWANTMRPESLPDVVPVHEEAEQALIGAVLARNEHFDRVNNVVTEDHFHDPVLARVWKWITAMMRRNIPATVNSLAPNMRALAKLPPDHPEYLPEEKANEYLESLTSARNVITLPSVVDGNATMVRDYACRRAVIEACELGLVEARSATADKDPADMVRALMEVLGRIEATGATTQDKTLAQAVAEALAVVREAQAGEVGIPTGILSLDRKIGGLRKRALYILAGRPAMGKSIIGFQILRNAAHQCFKEGKGVALGISYEMGADQLAQRYLADLANMTIDRQMERLNETADARRMGDLEDAAEQLAVLPMILNDDPPTGIAALTSYVKRVHREHIGGIRVLVVDYLQLMGGGGKGDREQFREQIVAEISRGLKAIARDLNIPVVALAQLNRSVEQREDKRPKLSDLRESGSIEQDADCVMFCYREAYYLEQNEPQDGSEYTAWLARLEEVKNKAEIIVAKLRQGKTGTVSLEFDGAHFVFNEPKVY